jgi:hypothetical protein
MNTSDVLPNAHAQGKAIGEALAEAVLSGRCKGLFFIFIFKKITKEAPAEGLLCQVAAKVLYMCIYIKETKTKIPQHRW